jgi:hypothetical protein
MQESVDGEQVRTLIENVNQREVEREMLPGGIRRDLEKIERPGVKQLVGEVSE